MFNGAALVLTAKRYTITVSSSCHAEVKELFNCGISVKVVRNLTAELGMCQQRPTVIYQDNQSAIKIANNRSSLGVTSRSMDLDTLSIRNMVEDHEVATKYKPTDL